MHWDPTVSVGNLLTVLGTVIVGGGFLCRVVHELVTLRCSMRCLAEEYREYREWAARIHILMEERIRTVEDWQTREAGRQERGP